MSGFYLFLSEFCALLAKANFKAASLSISVTGAVAVVYFSVVVSYFS